MTANNFCHCCLNYEISELIDLSAESPIGINYSEMLEFLLGFIELDRHFNYLCHKCEIKLVQSYSFKQQCIENSKKIQQIKCNGMCEEEVIADDYVENNIYLKPESRDNNEMVNITTKIEVDDRVHSDQDDENHINSSYTNVTSFTKTLFNCAECDIELNSAKEYNAHCIQFHSSKKNHLNNSLEAAETDNEPKKLRYVLRCQKCDLYFNSRKEYNYHYRKLHKKKNLCPQCGKIIVNQNMNEHIQSHVSPKHHICTQCGKSFTMSSNLRHHERIHTNERRYKCQYCDKDFVHWNSRLQHTRVYHTGEKKFKCTLCDSKFPTRIELTLHIRIHTGETPHECTECPKKFRTKKYLRNHMATHTNEKNQVCNVCNKAFKTRRVLLTHMKTHTGERNYICKICSKGFTQAHVLRSHMKTHPGAEIPAPGTVLSIKKVTLRKTEII